MNVLLVSIDSLRKDFLSTYQEVPNVVDYEVDTTHLDRFAERASVFESHYAGSLPCIPTRREWLAGIQEFLWRSWGPIEPFDETIPRLARQHGTLTQLITDHYHYFQHGAHGYFEDFNAFEFVRGHEYDAWKTGPRDPDREFLDQIDARAPRGQSFLNRAAYARNVEDFEDTTDFFSPTVFSKAEERIEDANEWSQWFTYVDSFDIHEPFHCPDPYASMYTTEDPHDPELPIWPYYGRIDEEPSELSQRELDFVRSQFAGKVTMVDEQFGALLDLLDRRDLWEDTMVIVTSDHGYFLGDHGWIGKNAPPVYDVLANTPLMIWHPDTPRTGERINEVTSAVDLYATILETLGVDVPEKSHSRSLLGLLTGETDTHREWALYGYWGTTINVTDGRHTYHRPSTDDRPAYNHSTMMMNPNDWFLPPKARENAESGSYLPYTDTPVWRYTATTQPGPEQHLNVSVQHDDVLLYDTETDPRQTENLAGVASNKQAKLRALLVDALRELDAPPRERRRFGLEATDG